VGTYLSFFIYFNFFVCNFVHSTGNLHRRLHGYSKMVDLFVSMSFYIYQHGSAEIMAAYLLSTPEGRDGARPGPAKWWSSPDLQRSK
jgi:hypothetical protein